MAANDSERTPEALARLLGPTRLDASDAEPIFVLGSVRSGTSIVVKALREGAGLPGFLEGNVLSLLQRMLDEVARQFDMTEEYLADRDSHLISNLDREGLENYLVNYFVALYLKHHGPGRWVDKSPESYLTAPMIRSAPLLRSIFPKARFLFCIRRPIENILSKQRKFPGLAFKHYCRGWTDAVHWWGEFRSDPQNAGCFLELRQEAMALEPERTASELAAFLSLDDEERDRMSAVFTGPRAEQTRSAQEHRFLGIDETPWSWEEKAEFIELVGPFLPSTGYGLEAKLVRRDPLRLFLPRAEGAALLENLDAVDFDEPKPGELRLAVPADGTPASVRYLRMNFGGQRRFDAELAVPETAASGLVFRLALEADGADPMVFERELQPGQCTPLELDLDRELSGPHDVVISIRVSAPGDETVHGSWRNAAFR